MRFNLSDSQEIVRQIYFSESDLIGIQISNSQARIGLLADVSAVKVKGAFIEKREELEIVFNNPQSIASRLEMRSISGPLDQAYVSYPNLGGIQNVVLSSGSDRERGLTGTITKFHAFLHYGEFCITFTDLFISKGFQRAN